MSYKLDSMLTPHIHWIVRPKFILPMHQNPTPTMAYLALETTFFFCSDFFCSHYFNIPKNLSLATIAQAGMWALHYTFWIPSAARIIRRKIQIQSSGLSWICGHGVETLQLDERTTPHGFRVGRNLQRIRPKTHSLVLEGKPKRVTRSFLEQNDCNAQLGHVGGVSPWHGGHSRPTW